MLRKEDVAEVLQRPEVLGRLVGFTDLTALHGEWIHEMVFGDEDYTLQAHRGAFKSSCLAVAIPLYMVLYPNRNVIFLRKTDHDVGEMMNMVAKVLQSDVIGSHATGPSVSLAMHGGVWLWGRRGRQVMIYG